MDEEMSILTPNQRKIILLFLKNWVREDHYDGKNELYRLTASLYSITGKWINKGNILTKENIEDIKLLLSSLSIPPHRIFITYDNVVVDWIPNGALVLNSKDEYLQLVLDFIAYLDKLDFVKFDTELDSFGDDPQEPYEDTENLRKVCYPKFTVENFGAIDREIEVYDCRGQKKDS